MIVIWTFSILFLLLYCTLIYNFRKGWKNIPGFMPLYEPTAVFITVLLAVRNEEDTIGHILNDLRNQDYPSENFEVLLINDHSEDETEKRIQKEISHSKNMRLLDLRENRSGKKAAVGLGISNAGGELIVTVDADCRVHKKWLSTMASFYEAQGKPDMIIGLVDLFPSESFTGKLQHFEFLSLIGSGAGAAGASHPVMCNGANLAYKKETYLQLSDPMNSGSFSGDDVFLLLQLKRKKRKIRVLRSPESIVRTYPAPTLNSFLNQRKRWISKARYYRDADIIVTALLIFIINLIVLFSLGLLIAGIDYLLFPLVFIVKSIADFFFMKPVLLYFRQQQLLQFLLVVQFIYPFYMLITSLAGYFSNYSWKNRTLK